MADIYEFVDKDLYKISNESSATESSIKSANSAGDETYSETLTSGEIDGTMSFTGGFIQSKNFVSGTSGWRLSANGTLEAVNATLSGAITATSGTIGGFSVGSDYIRDAANSMGIASTVTASDDVRFWAGASFANRTTAPFRITEAGAATFVGITSLNTQAFTCFETSGRFVQSTGATGANTFGNQGLSMTTGATADSFARALWNVAHSVFANNPTFSCTLFMNALNAGTNSGEMFVGLGTITAAGSGHTFSSKNFCGFTITKASGTVTIVGISGNGSSYNTTAALTTVVDSDVVDLILKLNTASTVDFYFRKNGLALSAATTLSGTAATNASPDTNVQCSISNLSTATTFNIVVQNASFQH